MPKILALSIHIENTNGNLQLNQAKISSVRIVLLDKSKNHGLGVQKFINSYGTSWIRWVLSISQEVEQNWVF